MEPKDRNQRMDAFLSGYFNSYYREAIRECDKLARAWNALREWLPGVNSGWKNGADENLVAIPRCLDKMAELLSPPQPKDPLGVLEEWAEKQGKVNVWICLPDVLAEIRRLRGAK